MNDQSYLESLFGQRGRTAVVTGATSGLGTAVACALGRVGAHVVVVGRDAERGRDVVAKIEAEGGSAELELVDVCDEAEVVALAERVRARRSSVDVLVNAAGIYAQHRAEELSLADWERIFRVNVTGTFLTCREFGRQMLEQGSGRIVNFGSTDGVIGVPEQVAYCVSKAAVTQLTRSLAVEWARRGVLVNCIAPGEFATAMTESLHATPGFARYVDDAIPSGRVGEPSELVSAVLMLVAPSTTLIVGHTLLVDGGRTAI